MARHVAFLRAINVGGRQAPKAQLVAAFEAAGCEDVTTFRASGNVLFSTPAAKPPRERIEQALGRELGYEVVAILRTEAQVRAVARQEPFPPEAVAASAGKLQVGFMAEGPSAARREALEALRSEEDRIAVKGSEVFWLPSGGMMESPIGKGAIEKAGGPMTMRTMGTVELIAEKLGAGKP